MPAPSPDDRRPGDRDPALQVWLALTTEANAALAEALARRLLDAGLVACVSLQPLQSLYIWDGQLEGAQEVQLLLKTDGLRLAALQTAVHRWHSYATPEWLTWRAQASAGYGTWLAGVLSAERPAEPRSVSGSLSPDAGPPGP